MSPPLLSRKDVADRLDELYKAQRNRHLIAFFGTGTEEVVNTTHAGQFTVLPVASELELRERMPPITDRDARIAFLVPFATDIPLDLSGRFALSGRVQQVGPSLRLARILGVPEVDDEARRSALGAYLLATSPDGLKVPSGRGTLVAMWNAWLGAAWGLDVTGGLGLDTLLGWAALDLRGAQFTEAMGAPAATGVRKELLSTLTAQLGEAAAVAWAAWEQAKGRQLLEYSLLFETLAPSEHAGVKMWVSVAPKAALALDPGVDMPSVAAALGNAADGALRHVERRTDKTTARGIVKGADALVDNPEIAAALVGDRRLPRAWTARLEKLAATLTAVAAAPSRGAVEVATTALRELENHDLFSDSDKTRVIRRAEMAVRLAAFLASRRDRELVGPATPYGDAELLARWYVEEGGFVDWARKTARGTASDAFGKGVEAVVAAADQAREDLDHRFACGLKHWVEAGRPASQIVPIDQAVKKVAVRFLEDDAERRLLVLLIDGMAWAQAVEILQSLAARTVPWGPLAWHASSKGKIGSSVYPAVMANLPTITDVSRAAFFAGKPLAPGAEWKTSKDVERWATNGEVKKLLPATEPPKLLLRGEGHTQSGVASPEALTLVGDTSRRIVAIVINAIDASLKSDSQQAQQWDVDSIKSLADLLEKAREAGRAVLLASDHGHVPADRLANQGSFEKAGARWRPWKSADEKLGPRELGFTGSTIAAPPGAHGVVLLTDDASRYGGAAHAGEHGGASLAEVVAPCVLIGCEDLADGPHNDSALGVQAAYVPDWWHFELSAGKVEAAPVKETGKPKKSVNVNVNQLSLLPEPAPPPAPAAQPAASAFGSSAVLASLVKSDDLRKQIVEAVDLLLSRQGVASDASFAAALKLPAWRVGGRVAVLQETLNIDGYVVIRYDGQARTIHLDAAKLGQLFEVKL